MTQITSHGTDTNGPTPDLSGPAMAMWAKSRNEDGNHLPLWRHMADAAAITRRLWDALLPAATQSLIAEAVRSAGLAQRLIAFLAAAHDVGKACPVFAAMPGVGLDQQIRDTGLSFPTISPQERREFPHSLAGYRALSTWLQLHHGWTKNEAAYLAAVPGGHHGRFPSFSSVTGDDRRMGDDRWRGAQDELLTYAADIAAMTSDDFAALRSVRLSQPAAIVVTALVIVGDWLASTESLFPFADRRDSLARADAAMRRLALPKPWQPRPPDLDTELFRSRHALEAPRPVQTTLAQLARELPEPELMIVEAPTGEGKTKAALAAAEILCARFGLGGVVFALPTRATSDAVFSEVRRWLPRTLETDDVTVSLVHGTAEFNPEYDDLLRPSGIHDDEHRRHEGTAVANYWLSGRGKLATLSSVVVCTIDQVLVAGLAAKHVVLRHLGLSGKVVILDEVHAADSYMTEYLKRALMWLGAYNVPVIALSATLPPARRAALLDAYNQGKKRRTRASGSPVYPILTTSDPDGSRSIPLAPSGRTAQIMIDELPGHEAEIAAAAVAAAAAGGRIAIVCNTVSRAQNVTRCLVSANSDATVKLLHSRFLGPDRRQREEELRDLLGPAPSAPRVASDALIVVATQVIEQSLDLDFDLMFSDVAPIDLLIQRAGRLHRHARADDERPATMREPRLVLTGFARCPDGAPDIDRGCAAVYGSAALLRSLAVLDEHRATLGAIRSPDDVASLVTSAYQDELPPPADWEGSWAEAADNASIREARQVGRAGDFTIDRPKQEPLVGWPSALAADPSTLKGLAQVRDADDAIEVVLIERDASGHLIAPRWDTEIRGEQVDLGTVVEDLLARRLAQDTVRLPAHLGRGRGGDLLIDALERQGFIDTWQQSRWLRGALPLILGPDARARLADHEFEYDDALGLVVDYRGES
ncbi:CRISPR-associated helicase Cas3' [Tsukamurella sp. NPDC003166]|uniref:CRISPR-associated helicase Cas3' n=1 Tax=Tsukamurella sp. NPDC003166 TaxID=3154444 RepID=UPI0033A682B6